jgi:hypothetical protein
MTTVTAKSSMLVGSLKNGIMSIGANEIVNVVKATEKCFYIEKKGLVKSFSKKCFY